MSIFLLCAIFSSSLIFNVSGVVTNPSVCDCNNPVYIDQPINIAQCYSKLKFYNQIKANYAITNGFMDQESAKDCDYTEYRNAVNEMEKVTKQIVDAYFSCTKRNCTDAILTAHRKYGDVARNIFAPIVLCSYTKLSPECAVNIKHSTYFSAENIVTTLIECANFKASCQRPDFKVLLNELLSRKTPDCNCVKIDPRPIPVSEEQCYSEEYISTVNKWIDDNFSRVKGVYHNASVANPQCDYSTFIELTIRSEQAAKQWPNILRKSSPTFKEFSSFTSELGALAAETNNVVRAYVLKENKTCYFAPRQLRQSALTILNYVTQILTKCVLYRDAENSPC